MNENKENAKKSIRSLVILLITSIGMFIILFYYFGPWIHYGENIAPPGAWTTAKSSRITVTRIGLIIRSNEYEMLDKKEQKELRILVREIKKNGISTSQMPDGEGLFISGKRYIIDENNKAAYQRIIEKLKEGD